MANIWREVITSSVPGNARSLNYKVGPVTDLSWGSRARGVPLSKKVPKEAKFKKKIKPLKFIFKQECFLFFLRSVTLKTYKTLGLRGHSEHPKF